MLVVMYALLRYAIRSNFTRLWILYRQTFSIHCNRPLPTLASSCRSKFHVPSGKCRNRKCELRFLQERYLQCIVWMRFICHHHQVDKSFKQQCTRWPWTWQAFQRYISLLCKRTCHRCFQQHLLPCASSTPCPCLSQSSDTHLHPQYDIQSKFQRIYLVIWNMEARPKILNDEWVQRKLRFIYIFW